MLFLDFHKCLQTHKNLIQPINCMDYIRKGLRIFCFDFIQGLHCIRNFNIFSSLLQYKYLIRIIAQNI